MVTLSEPGSVFALQLALAQMSVVVVVEIARALCLAVGHLAQVFAPSANTRQWQMPN
jgi:hypothetical protein